MFGVSLAIRFVSDKQTKAMAKQRAQKDDNGAGDDDYDVISRTLGGKKSTSSNRFLVC